MPINDRMTEKAIEPATANKGEKDKECASNGMMKALKNRRAEEALEKYYGRGIDTFRVPDLGETLWRRVPAWHSQVERQTHVTDGLPSFFRIDGLGFSEVGETFS